MKMNFKSPVRLLLGACTFIAVFAGDASGGFLSKLSLTSPAHAVIGRPLTPMSYAGVARRSTYRAVGYGAYGAAVVRPAYVAPAAVVVVQPTCVDTVSAYGVVTRVCR